VFDRYEFLDMIKNNRVILLVSDPGSGKTVIIPKLLSHYFDYQKKIIVTTPRQKTTVGAASWSSILMDVKLGKEIGLRHGNEKRKDGPLTKILYTTDGSPH
jgi:pre-mRNA-splicing factor ATP-dependent RNA helicase DHX15/PRP43